MLWAIPVGILVGLAARGSLGNLSAFKFRWAPLAIAGLLVQVVLFTSIGDSIAGGAAPAIYVASTAAVFAAVLRNLRMTGMPIVALGSLSNLAAISANGGAMPADPGALAMAGLDGAGSHTNSVILENPALQPLTDIYALPAWLPLANVFSVGDVLMVLGAFLVLHAATGSRLFAPGRSPGAEWTRVGT